MPWNFPSQPEFIRARRRPQPDPIEDQPRGPLLCDHPKWFPFLNQLAEIVDRHPQSRPEIVALLERLDRL